MLKKYDVIIKYAKIEVYEIIINDAFNEVFNKGKEYIFTKL